MQNTSYKSMGSGIFQQKEYTAAAGFPLGAPHPMVSQLSAWLGSSETLPGAVVGNNPCSSEPRSSEPRSSICGVGQDLAIAHGKCKIPGTLQGSGSHSPGAVWRSLQPQRLPPGCWGFHHLHCLLHWLPPWCQCEKCEGQEQALGIGARSWPLITGQLKSGCKIIFRFSKTSWKVLANWYSFLCRRLQNSDPSSSA